MTARPTVGDSLPLPTVLVRGGGDLATGIAWRLFRCGFPLVVLELARPLAVRRTVSFAQAVFDGSCEVEGARAILVGCPSRIEMCDHVPVVVDAAGDAIRRLSPQVVVDARMMKSRNDTRLDDAPLVVALGPGLEAGRDCHLVVETKRGHFLGRVYAHGAALPDSGVPGELSDGDAGTPDVGVDRVLRAPCDGLFETRQELGAWVEAGQQLGKVSGMAVTASITGTLRGLIHSGVSVQRGLKVGDVDPRASAEVNIGVISDKSRAVAGGVLEAILGRWWGRV